MNELDETILIAAAPEDVWSLVSDINQNPSWQSDCQSVIFLSKQRSGKGTRWRYRNLSDKEYELEVTAWYDGLGYEYQYLDGSAHGRIRLQEIAEGTTVQWTFSYEIRGRLGGMRNALGAKRSWRKHLVDSLQALQATLNRTVGIEKSYEARSLMRDAISYDARASYKPRHPSQARLPDGAAQVPQIEEAPALEEDTRPNPVYADADGDSPLARQPVESEPVPPAVDFEAPGLPAQPSVETGPSIWDVFGIDRPEPVAAATTVVKAPDPVTIRFALDAIQSGHPGLRKLLRAAEGNTRQSERT